MLVGAILLPNPLSVSYSNWQVSDVESVLTDPFRVAEVVVTELAPRVETMIAVEAVTAAEILEVAKVVGDPGRVLRRSLSSSESPSFKSSTISAALIPASISPS